MIACIERKQGVDEPFYMVYDGRSTKHYSVAEFDELCALMELCRRTGFRCETPDFVEANTRRVPRFEPDISALKQRAEPSLEDL